MAVRAHSRHDTSRIGVAAIGVLLVPGRASTRHRAVASDVTRHGMPLFDVREDTQWLPIVTASPSRAGGIRSRITRARRTWRACS